MKEVLNFKSFQWIVVQKKTIMPCNEVYYKYRVYRKYFKRLISLSNTKCAYWVSESRWEHLKSRLLENPNFHYTMEFWSGIKKIK